MVGLAQLPSPKRGRSQRLPLSHKTPLQLSKNLIPKHRPNPGRHASQSVTRTSTPLPATSPSHPNSDIYVGLLVPTRLRSRSCPHGVTSQRIPQDEKPPPHEVAAGFFHVRGRAGKLPHADSGQLCSLGLEHAQETVHKQCSQSGTDKRSDARNEQAVLPVVVSLVLDRQHLIGHARTKVTSLVHAKPVMPPMPMPTAQTIRPTQMASIRTFSPARLAAARMALMNTKVQIASQKKLRA